jgi:L-fuconolactonase
MHIDAHQHFWHYSPEAYRWISPGVLAQDYLPADLRPLLNEAGVDGTVVVQARSTWEETRWLLTLAEHYPWIIGVVGWADLCAPDLDEQLAYFSTYPAFCGIRCSIETEPDSAVIPSEAFLEGLSALTARDLAFDLLIGPHQLSLAHRLVEAAPHQRFILDHLAKPRIGDQVMEPWTTDIRTLAAHRNVACKVSGMVDLAKNSYPEVFQPYLDTIFAAFGPDRLMIGSDWPVSLQATPYEATMQLVLDYVAQMPHRAQDAVLGGTAIKWYRLTIESGIWEEVNQDEDHRA